MTIDPVDLAALLRRSAALERLAEISPNDGYAAFRADEARAHLDAALAEADVRSALLAGQLAEQWDRQDERMRERRAGR